jgi:hypothetical protein
MKKPRGDAKLKILPDALQEELWQILRRTTHEKAEAWLLSKHGIATSPAALSHFFSWYPRQGWLKQAANFSDTLKATLKNLPALKATAAEAEQIAQVNFEILAAQNRDAELFLALRKEKREAKKLTLDERRIAILEKKASEADEARKVTEDRDLSPEEQLTRFKQIFGGQ